MWIRVRLAVPDSDLVEVVAADLWALGATGWEARDDDTFSELSESSFERATAGRTELIAYFETDSQAPDLHALTDAYTGLELIGVQPIDDTNWRESWRQYFVTTRVSPRVTVRPSWAVPPRPEPGQVILVIDPGLAFGTGTHETTASCLEIIDERLAAGRVQRFLDVGCGSGILTMAAAALGAGRVHGVDNDPEAIRVACENWEANGFGAASAAPFALSAADQPSGPWDLVVANMLSGILLGLADALARWTAAGGRLVLSGLLDRELDGFVAAFPRDGLTLIDQRQRGEWVTLTLARP